MPLYSGSLGETHSTRSPKERAMRLLYMQANRNRYKDPGALAKVADMAEQQGIDVSGSQSDESVQFSRQRDAMQAGQAAELASMPMEFARDSMRQDMMQAARMGLTLSEFRRRFRARGLALGAKPDVLERSFNDYASMFSPKTTQQPSKFEPLPPGYSGPPTPIRP